PGVQSNPGARHTATPPRQTDAAAGNRDMKWSCPSKPRHEDHACVVPAHRKPPRTASASSPHALATRLSCATSATTYVDNPPVILSIHRMDTRRTRVTFTFALDI